MASKYFPKQVRRRWGVEATEGCKGSLAHWFVSQIVVPQTRVQILKRAIFKWGLSPSSTGQMGHNAFGFGGLVLLFRRQRT